MAVKELLEFLDNNSVKYVTINHSLAYTSQEVAASAHVNGSEFAKTVIVKVDDRLVMVVLPANKRVNLDAIKSKTGAKTISVATENEFQRKFKGCELGAMPPFGNLFDMDVLVDDSLSNVRHITFNAGTHLELVKLAFKDFNKLVHPTIEHISQSG